MNQLTDRQQREIASLFEGRLIAPHPDVAKVSLTGEVGTGKIVMANAAATLKQVTLELGGKSPLIIFDDADLDNAVSAALMANFYTQGEICSNGTRVYVHEEIHDEFLDRLVTLTSKMKIGDPMDPDTHVGALISKLERPPGRRWSSVGSDPLTPR